MELRNSLKEFIEKTTCPWTRDKAEDLFNWVFGETTCSGSDELSESEQEQTESDE